MVNLPNTTILSQLAEDLRRLIGINRNHKSGEKITLGIPTIDDYISMGFLVLDLKRTSQSTKLSSDVLENLKAIPNGVPSIVFEIQNLILEIQPLHQTFLNDVDFSQYPDEISGLLWNVEEQLEQLSSAIDFFFPKSKTMTTMDDFNEIIELDSKIESGEYKYIHIPTDSKNSKSKFGGIIRNIESGKYDHRDVIRETKDEFEPNPQRVKYLLEELYATMAFLKYVNDRETWLKVKDVYSNLLEVFRYDDTEREKDGFPIFKPKSNDHKDDCSPKPEPNTTADFSHMKKKSANFDDVIQHPDKARLKKRFHELIDGKSGADVGCVFLQARIKGFITRNPKQSEFKSEFDLIGSWSAIKKYMDDNNQNALERANRIVIFE